MLIRPIEQIPENIYSAKINIFQLSNMCNLTLVTKFKYMDKSKILCSYNSGTAFTLEGYELGTFKNRLDVSLVLEGRFMNSYLQPKYRSVPISVPNLFLFTQLVNTSTLWITDPEYMKELFHNSGSELLLTEKGKETCLTMQLDNVDIQLRPHVAFISDTYYRAIQILISDKDDGVLYTNVINFNWCALSQLLNNLDIVSAGIGVLNLYGPRREEYVFEDRREFAPKIEAVRYDTVNNDNKIRTRKIAAKI